MSIEALKEQARKHEQNEEWSEALQVYVEAINRQSDDDQPDLGMYNRAGDLSTRLGDSVGAIQYYEQAVDLYLEAELPNNAIAILKKILRNLPARSEVFLRMGQIRANQGFLTDARNNFLTYAERRQQEGDMDEAFRALEEFADVAPGDVEVRLALADQLHAHERTPEALQQLARAYHQYQARGEAEAAEGIERRIHEIDAEFVIPASDVGAFETNVLGSDDEFSTGFESDPQVEGSFDEIALDGDDTEIAFDSGEDVDFGSSDEPTLEVGAEEIAFDDSDEISIEDEEASFGLDAEAVDEFAATPIEASDDDVFGFETAEDFDDADAFAESASEEALDFETAVMAPEGDVAVDDGAPLRAEHEGMVEGADEEAPLADQDDWEVGADLEDAFISFDSTEAADEEAVAVADASLDEEGDWDFEAPTGDAELPEAEQVEPVEASAELDEEWPEPDTASWSATAEDDAEEEASDVVAAAFDDSADEEVAELDEAITAGGEDDGFVSTETDEAFEIEAADDLPLIGFDNDDEAFDAEALETAVEVESEFEPATAVAVEGEFAADAETDEFAWSEEPASEAAELESADTDELWTEVSAEEELDVAAEHTAESVEESADEDDEWIGLSADADAAESEDEADDLPSLADFEAYSLSDLREYVQDNADSGAAWERIGRLSLEDGDVPASQEAFEESHLAYARAEDFMSAMRCVRELLLGEPDQIEYHQRLVEYARHADDRTLLVSAYLELADCLARTGAPAKARAVHQKVLDIDPTNRRAAAATGEETPEEPAADESEASYVDLGSMVIEQGEKTTRWTVEAEEPAGEADFDFQDMLAQFKAKVAENVDIGDVKAHYDLGTAYKEMGLVEEAITEFQAALRADGQNLATYEMLGQCFMDKGQPEMAVRSLSKATQMPFDVEDELLGIYYYLGRAHEELGNRDDAVEYYEKIFALDINFEDVTERLRALR